MQKTVCDQCGKDIAKNLEIHTCWPNSTTGFLWHNDFCSPACVAEWYQKEAKRTDPNPDMTRLVQFASDRADMIDAQKIPGCIPPGFKKLVDGELIDV